MLEKFSFFVGGVICGAGLIAGVVAGLVVGLEGGRYLKDWRETKSSNNNNIDVEDEEARAAAFKKSVMDWRQSSAEGVVADESKGEWTLNVSKK